jgi:hypothetical protein
MKGYQNNMMNVFTKDLLGKKIIAHCDANLLVQAEWLLEQVWQIGIKKGFLKNGETIQLGWTVIKIKEVNNEFILCEPNFTENPFETCIESVNISLITLAQQSDVLNKLQILGEPTLFSDKVIYSDDCLSQEKIYLERQSDVSKGDSGWFIGSVSESSKKSELKAMYAYQLLLVRPELLSVLSLPKDYIAVFNKSTIEAILNENNQNIWN